MLKNDNVANAAYVGKQFKDYDELKAAFLRGQEWLSILAAEYNEAYQSEMKADKGRMETEIKQLKNAHAESVAALDQSWVWSGVSNLEQRTQQRTQRDALNEQRKALNEQHRADLNAVVSRLRIDHPARVRTQVLQQLARPPSPPPQEALPDYSLMNAD